MPTLTAADLVPQALSPAERAALRRRARHAVGFGVLDARAGAHFDDPRSALVFARRYRDLRRDGEAALRTYAVRDDAGRAHFWSGDGPAYAWPHGPLPPTATAFFADAFATHELLSSIPAGIALHAAALRWGDAAFALTGCSTAGKSTTALACVAAGAQLYSDERCITTPAGTVPYPRALSLRRGGLELLADTLPEGDLRARLARHRGADWGSAPFEEVFGSGAVPEPAPLRALFAIVGRDAVPRSRPLAPVAMLPLAGAGANVGAKGVDRVHALLELCRGVACFELVLGAPLESARHVLARVDALRASRA